MNKSLNRTAIAVLVASGVGALAATVHRFDSMVDAPSSPDLLADIRLLLVLVICALAAQTGAWLLLRR